MQMGRKRTLLNVQTNNTYNQGRETSATIPIVQVTTTHVCPEGFVVILLLCRRVYFRFRFRRLCRQYMYCVFVGGIDIRLRSGYSNFNLILVFANSNNPEVSRNLVVTFCTPRHVVNVGELRGRGEWLKSISKWRARTAYTFKTAIYDGAIKRYCKKEVIMCQGSN